MVLGGLDCRLPLILPMRDGSLYTPESTGIRSQRFDGVRQLEQGSGVVGKIFSVTFYCPTNLPSLKSLLSFDEVRTIEKNGQPNFRFRRLGYCRIIYAHGTKATTVVMVAFTLVIGQRTAFKKLSLGWDGFGLCLGRRLSGYSIAADAFLAFRASSSRPPTNASYIPARSGISRCFE